MNNVQLQKFTCILNTKSELIENKSCFTIYITYIPKDDNTPSSLKKKLEYNSLKYTPCFDLQFCWKEEKNNTI